MKESLIIRGAAIALLAGGLLAAPGVAFAAAPATSTAPPAAVQTLESFWSAHGVPAAVQSALIAKLEAGGQLDALNGGRIVSSSTTTSGDTTTTVQTYADGSIAVVTLGPPARSGASPQTAGNTSCHLTSTTGNSNSYQCTVAMNTGEVNMNYQGRYVTRPVAADQITQVSSFQYSCAWPASPCTASQPQIVRAIDQPSLSAMAQASVTYTGAASGNEWLRFFVHNGVASSSYN